MEDYILEFEDKWLEYYTRLPSDIQERIKKKLLQLKYLPSRHLGQGVDYFVKEVGQYRIVFKSDDIRMIRRFYFVGKHKEYEKFIGIRK